jgi:addiction module HigA family antidote
MLPKKRIRTHPETILRGEFLEPLGVSQVAFAEHLGIPLQRVNVIVRGERGVRSDTSWLYAGALRARPEFWTNFYVARDLAASRPAQPVKRLRPSR